MPWARRAVIPKGEKQPLSACDLARGRAYAAAPLARIEAGISHPVAEAHMRAYIGAVRSAPKCFDKSLRKEVDRAASALERGQLLPLTFPKYRV